MTSQHAYFKISIMNNNIISRVVLFIYMKSVTLSLFIAVYVCIPVIEAERVIHMIYNTKLYGLFSCW